MQCHNCKELKLLHVTAYYHKNGYVEIKLKSEINIKTDFEILATQL